MIIVTILYELLFPAVASVDRRHEIPDLSLLESRTKRAQGGIDIVCLRLYRAIINTIDEFNLVPAGKGHSNGMPG